MIALGKYLASLSDPLDSGNNIQKKTVSLRRKRLHLLYLINDLLHHTKHHEQKSAQYISLRTHIEPHLIDLVKSAASFDALRNKKLHSKLFDLVKIWEENEYYNKDFCNKLRETAETAGNSAGDKQGNLQETAIDAGEYAYAENIDVPSTFPAAHGDHTGHWSDLPAGCMMRLITRNSVKPIRVREMTPLELNMKSADPEMVEAVKVLLKEARQIYNPYHQDDEGIVADIDEMGQRYYRDKGTGNLQPGETYYGWSRNFAESMQKRRLGRKNDDSYRGGTRSQSFSPHKRRRYSSSSGRSYTRSRSPSRTRFRSREYSPRRSSYSGSRSPSRVRNSRNDRSRSYTRSRSPSQQHQSHRRREYSPRRSSFSASHSPSGARTSHNDRDHNSADSRSSAHHAEATRSGANLQNFTPRGPQFNQGPNCPVPPAAGIQVPPPPSNWMGPWPPPPPPPSQLPHGPLQGANGYGRGWGSPMGPSGEGWGRGWQGWGRGGWYG